MHRIFRAHCVAFVITVIAGVLLHLLYKAFPNPLTAIFSPVNESVWEHLKIIFWPYLAAAFVLTRRRDLKSAGYWAAHCAVLLLMPLLMVVIYYFLNSALGIESLWMDIILYVGVMAVGFYLSYRLYSSNGARDYAPLLYVLTAALAACLILFTFAPPMLPLFIPPEELRTWVTIPY